MEKRITEFEDYSITPEGAVYSYKWGKKKRLKLQHDESGYLFVRLYNKKTVRSIYVHKLVAEAFIENLDKKPTVNHIDGCKTNNNIENLEWATHKENMRHAFKTKLIVGNKGVHRKLSNKDVIKIRRRRKNGESCNSIAKDYPVNAISILFICKGETWKHLPL